MDESTSTAPLASPDATCNPPTQWRLGDRNYRILSELTGVGKHYLGCVLRGRSKASLAVEMKIAEAAGVELSALQAYLQSQRDTYQRIEKPNGRRTLTDDDAISIRQRYANRAQVPVTVRSLALDYGVSRQTISLIIRHIIYKLLIAA